MPDRPGGGFNANANAPPAQFGRRSDHLQARQQQQQEKEANALNDLSEEQREEIDEAVRFVPERLFFYLLRWFFKSEGSKGNI